MAFFVCLFPLPPSQQKRAKMKRKGESHATTVLLLLDLLAMLPACIPTVREAGETPLSCSNIQHNTWETEETKETTREISIFKSATLWPILKTPTGGWYNAHPKRAFPSLQIILGAWGDVQLRATVFWAWSIHVFIKWIPWRVLKLWHAPHCHVPKSRQTMEGPKDIHSSEDVPEVGWDKSQLPFLHRARSSHHHRSIERYPSRPQQPHLHMLCTAAPKCRNFKRELQFA